MNGQKKKPSKNSEDKTHKIEIFTCRSECGYKIEFEFD